MAKSPSLAEELRSRGLRLTAQRQLVLEAVCELGHATPEQVHSKVSAKVAGVNITTVYRALDLLERLGLVTHAHLSHGPPTYHAVGGEEHVHVVCRSCGTVSEISSAIMQPVADQLEREQAFRLDVAHVALFGLCGPCLAKEENQ